MQARGDPGRRCDTQLGLGDGMSRRAQGARPINIGRIDPRVQAHDTKRRRQLRHVPLSPGRDTSDTSPQQRTTRTEATFILSPEPMVYRPNGRPGTKARRPLPDERRHGENASGVD